MRALITLFYFLPIQLAFGQIFAPAFEPIEKYAHSEFDQIAIPYDLDFDGDQDLINGFENGFFNFSGIHLNNGKNQFDTIFTDYRLESPVDIGDVDGDGNLDIYTSYGIYGYQSAGLRLIDINGFPSWGREILLSDFDGDGHEDILYGQDNRLVIGYFDNFNLSDSIIDSHPREHEFVIGGDINNDGLEDIISISNFSTKDIRVFTNLGDRKFLKTVYPLRGKYFYTWIECADMNSDGNPDIIYGSSDSVFIRYNTLTGFSEPVSILKGETQMGRAKDLNNDGMTDIVLIHELDFQVNLIYALSKGNGTYEIHQIDEFVGISGGWTESQAFRDWLHLQDMDGDGDIDILVFDYDLRELLLFENILPSTVHDINHNIIQATPNPTTNDFTLQTDNLTYPILVLNVNGKVVKVIDEKELLNFQGLSSGCYFVTGISSNNKFISRIIKI